MNNKKLILERLELLKVESGLSDKAFKATLSTITGKTPRTVRRWFSLESNIHEGDIERISKFFGKHAHWLRYGDHNQTTTSIDQIMNSNHFGAVILKEDKVENVNFKFIEMMGLEGKDIPQQDICDYILQLQSEETINKCKLGLDEALNKGAHSDSFDLVLGDGFKHIVDSTTLNLNHNRVLRIIFDRGLVDQKEQKLSDNNIKFSEQPSIRVMFVDDDITNCQLYNSMLSLYNCDVKTFNSSLHALDEFKCNHDNYDIVISDIIMPDLTGDKLADECRQISPDIPVILCTGYAEHLNRTTAEEFGVSYYLQKPIRSEKLISLINKFR